MHVSVTIGTINDAGAITAGPHQLNADGLSEEQRARLADIAERTPVTLTFKSAEAITTTLDSAMMA